MTKEEFKKEAEEWLSKKWTPYDFYDTECNVYNDDIKEDLIKGYIAGAKETEMEFEKSLFEKGVCLQSDLDEAKEIIKFAMERIKKIVCEERCDFVNKEFFCGDCSYGKWIAKAEAFLKFEA